MEKLLIYENTEAINYQKERASFVYELLQKVYAKLAAKNYSPNLVGLKSLVIDYCQKIESSHLESDAKVLIQDYLKNLIIDSNPKGLQIGGIKLTRQALAGMVEICTEDEHDILADLSGLEKSDMEFLEIIGFDDKANKVVINPDFEKQIEAKNSFYAIGEKQIRIVKALSLISDGLAELDQLTGKQQSREIPIEGLLFKNGKCVPDHSYVSHY